VRSAGKSLLGGLLEVKDEILGPGLQRLTLSLAWASLSAGMNRLLHVPALSFPHL